MPTTADNRVPLPDPDAPGPKEQVYDAEINPLMAQIIDICKRHEIGMLCTFELDPGLKCTSAAGAVTPEVKIATEMVLHGYAAYAVTTRRQ